MVSQTLTGGFRAVVFQFPDSAEGGIYRSGWSKRVCAMTRRAIILRFVVSTVLAVATMISFGIVYLTNRYPVAPDHTKAQHTLVPDSDSDGRLSRVHLLLR